MFGDIKFINTFFIRHNPTNVNYKRWIQYCTNYSKMVPNDDVIIYCNEEPEADDVPAVLEDVEMRVQYKKSGYFGKMVYDIFYEFKHQKTKVKYIVKAVPKTLTPRKQRRKVFDEVEIHETLCHENIARLARVFEDYSYIYLVTEPCLLGSLSYLLMRRRRLNLIEAKFYIGQVGMACNYLHSNLIVHGNLQPRNLYLDQNNNIKVANFGLAVQLENREDLSTSLCGSPGYLSPEILAQTGYDFKVDIWAIGCTLYELLVGKSPFRSKDPEKVRAMVQSAKYRDIPKDIEIAPYVLRFINRTLNVDPRKRPSIEQLLASHFFIDECVSDQLPVALVTHAEETRDNPLSTEKVLNQDNQAVSLPSSVDELEGYSSVEYTIYNSIQRSINETEADLGFRNRFWTFFTSCFSRK